MDTSLILSAGSVISAAAFFYAWHKDSKQTAKDMAQMEARIDSLETRMTRNDDNIDKLLESVQEIKVIITRIDTQVQQLMGRERQQ